MPSCAVSWQQKLSAHSNDGETATATNQLRKEAVEAANLAGMAGLRAIYKASGFLLKLLRLP